MRHWHPALTAISRTQRIERSIDSATIIVRVHEFCTRVSVVPGGTLSLSPVSPDFRPGLSHSAAEAAGFYSRLPQPILSWKSLDPREFLFIIGDDRIAQRECLGRNQQIVAADWFARLLKPCAKHSVSGICWSFEG